MNFNQVNAPNIGKKGIFLFSDFTKSMHLVADIVYELIFVLILIGLSSPRITFHRFKTC